MPLEYMSRDQVIVGKFNYNMGKPLWELIILAEGQS